MNKLFPSPVLPDSANVAERPTHARQPNNAVQAKDTARRNDAARWVLVWLIASIAFTVVLVNHAERRGRLLIWPTYDDSTYLTDGLRRLNTLDERGIRGLMGEYIALPPHSPLFSLLALGSYLLLGAHDWAPYMGTSVIVLAVLLSVDDLMRGATAAQRVGTALFVLSIPITGVCVAEYRPDCATGLATALAILLTLNLAPLDAHPNRSNGNASRAANGSAGDAVNPSTEKIHRASWRRRLAVGALWTAALLLKPTVAPLTIFLAALCIALQGMIWRSAHRRSVWSPLAWRNWLPMGLPTIVLAGPHYVVAFGALRDYIHAQMFGNFKDTWHVKGGWDVQARYFLDGPGGALMFGQSGFVLPGLLALLVGGWALVLYRRNPEATARFGAATILLFVAYIFPVVNQTKNPFFGATFQFLLVLMGVSTLREMFGGIDARPKTAAFSDRDVGTPEPACEMGSCGGADRAAMSAPSVGAAGVEADVAARASVARGEIKTRRARWRDLRFLAWAMIALFLCFWNWPASLIDLGPANSPIIAAIRNVEGGVYDYVTQHPPELGYSIYYTMPGYADGTALAYRELQDGINPWIIVEQEAATPDDYRQRFKAAGVVIASEGGTGLTHDFIPCGRYQDAALALLRTMPEFELTRTIPALHGKNIYVFDRVTPFVGFDRAQGLTPIEGPYPKWNMGHVRWAMFPEVRLTIDCPRAKTARLYLSALTPVKNQAIWFIVNGQALARTPLEKSDGATFSDFEQPMSLRAGENDVTLRFEQKDASKSPATSLLVRELCVLDEPAPTTRPADAWPAAN